MKRHRDANADTLKAMKVQFQHAIARVTAGFSDKAFRRVKVRDNGSGVWDSAINRAVFDIQMIGLYTLEIEQLEIISPNLISQFEKLCRGDEKFSDSITKATADRAKFYTRLQKFYDVLIDLGFESSRFDKIKRIQP